ncbi:hypothetical protein NPN19_24075, partial [Vibrio parahaemolyticus]|uniref:hypothetical protein n=1 Tax=Vibrio parahaemolyticus TaxID=670 RepID=UPI002112BBD8
RGFGSQLDERVIEHPWVVSLLRDRQGRLLDAGAGLNFDYVLLHPAVSDKEVTIVTLEPESQNFYRNRVGYLYHDLRKLPFKEDWFDTVVSVST